MVDGYLMDFLRSRFKTGDEEWRNVEKALSRGVAARLLRLFQPCG